MARHDDPVDTGTWVDRRLAGLRPDDAWQPNVQEGRVRFMTSRQVSARHGRRWTWATAAAVAAGLGLFLFPSTQILAQRCVAACVDQSSRVGRLFSRPSNDATGRLIATDRRTMAPDFTLRDRTGRPISLSGYRGKVVLINFWATWCPPCGVEIPWFQEFARLYEDRGFVVIGVSMDDDGWAPVSSYVNEHRLAYPIVMANDEVRQDYGDVTSLPTTFVIDREGRVASRRVGLTDKADYAGDIEAVLAK